MPERDLGHNVFSSSLMAELRAAERSFSNPDTDRFIGALVAGEIEPSSFNLLTDEIIGLCSGAGDGQVLHMANYRILDLPPVRLRSELFKRRETDGLDFPLAVACLDIESVVRRIPNKKIPKDLRNYKFVAIGGAEPAMPKTEATIIGLFGPTTDKPVAKVAIETAPIQLPIKRTDYAIGLNYKEQTVAVAGASFTFDDELEIVQLEAVDSYNNGQNNNSKLFKGFYWQDTLVQAWAEVAAKEFTLLEIRTAKNHINRHGRTLAELINDYDQVALRMGFARSRNGNMAIDLSRFNNTNN